MKKLLSILGTVSLITSGSSNLIACDNSELISENLAELKEKNSININGNILEWIVPQEKPFNEIDNKYYYVVWRGDKNEDWRIVKFQNKKEQRLIKFD
ncbi:lipoprotein [Spiroplasma endosymbiont of Ammophila pubescens]|uniref:lipoprotein n=1 Tax=Spiroplasma endosymbiont of Ammophila pubescens TaxID=3066315 RepID=UPI0032B2434F